MADKIVQLQDENGNNIFPIARGLGNNSVTTATIQDSAVTAAKIDRSNINYGTTSEDVRIGTFMGKPLWRKVQTFTNFPRGWSAHSWTNAIANFDMAVSANGMFFAGSETSATPINSLPPDNVATYGISVRTFDGNGYAVVLGSGMNTTNHGHIIFDYTTN